MTAAVPMTRTPSRLSSQPRRLPAALRARASVALPLLGALTLWACSAAEREPAASVKGLFELEPQDFGETLSGRVGVGARVDRVSTENLEAPRLSLRTTDSGAGDPFAFVVKTGVTLGKGEVLWVTAEGEVTSGDETFGTVGPDGSALWSAGYLAYMPSRPVLGLMGRIGTSTFPIGAAQTMLAPEAGELELVVNGIDRTKVPACEAADSPGTVEACGQTAGCSVEALREACTAALRPNPTAGGFDVTIHKGLRPGITLASEPRIDDNTVLSTSDHVVRAGAGWTKTGVVAKRGQKMFIDATGTLRAASAPRDTPSPPASVDANGARGWLAGARAVLPGRRPGRLFARIGSSIVETGVSAAFLAPREGEVELLVNDGLAPSYEGAFDVSLKMGIVPARGLLDVEAATYRTAEATLSGRAARAWQATALSVRRGAPIVVRAQGRLTYPEDIFGTREAGPEGVQGVRAGLELPVPSETYGALFGRVGEQVIYLGGEAVVLSPAEGVLELLVNVPEGTEGTVTVSASAP
jgi:hypothetical protein